jgi:PilZ domain
MSHAPESVSVVQESTTTFDRSKFATAAQLFREDLVVSIERFLKQRAVDIVMEGTYVLPNWYDPQGKLRTFACRATRVSPFRMMVDMPVVGKVGDSLTSYFRDIGNFEGTISDTARSGVLLELEMTQAMRAKLADKLTWLEKKTKDPTSINDARKTPRFVPRAAHSTLTLADGTIHSGFVIDASLSGAAVATEIRPPIGTPLGIGGCIGRVIRHTPDGIAVKFVKQQSRDELQGLIVRTALA